MTRNIVTLVASNLCQATRPEIRILGPQHTFKRYLTQEQKDKQFVDRPTPFQKEPRQCILCKHNIRVDYKNPRLLAQFVSPLNGRIYDKHITGLCEKQQTRIQIEIRKSRDAMYMPIFHRDPKFNRDPALFNPDRPQRPNPY